MYCPGLCWFASLESMSSFEREGGSRFRLLEGLRPGASGAGRGKS